MSVLGELFKDLGIAREKILDIVNELKKDPVAAMTMLQSLDLSKEAKQKIMETVMMQPKAIDELASELGLSEDVVGSIKKKIMTPGSD